MKVQILLIVIAVFYLSASYGQQDSTKVIPIEQVVVTATRTSANIETVPASVSVVTRDMIEKSHESSVLSLLPSYVPGLFVTQRGSTGFGVYSGSAGAITIRGAGASPTTQVLLAVDGQPQIMGINGHHLPDAFRTAEAERVEVIRGPASTIYGSNAMGGVINIITRQPKDGIFTNLWGEYGSFNTQKYAVSNSVREGRFSSFVSVGHDRTDGHRKFSAFHLTNANAKLGYDISKHYKVSANISASKYLSTDPGTIQNPAINDTMTADILRLMSSVAIENRYDKVSGALRVSYNHGVHDLYYGWNSRDNNIGVMFNQSMNLFEGSTITAGVDFKHYGGRATDSSKPNFNFNKYINETAGYIVAEQTLFGKLHLNAGVRLENNTNFGNEWVPQGGVAYSISKRSTVKASVAKGFRSPSLREMYVFAPNDSLKPEKMVNYELSYTYTSGKLRAEIAAYISDGSNIIETVFVNGIPRRNFNSGKFTNKGIEFGASYEIAQGARISANYSYIDLSKPIMAVPKHQCNIMGEYSIAKFTITANLQYVNGLYIRTGNAPAKENFTLLGASVSYSLNKIIELYIKSDNILDQQYQMNYGYPMPGISFSGGVRINI